VLVASKHEPVSAKCGSRFETFLEINKYHRSNEKTKQKQERTLARRDGPRIASPHAHARRRRDIPASA
jgi:hypothetical protein